MNVRITPNRDGFRRLRQFMEALQVSEGDMKGPVVKVLGVEHRRQVTRAFTSQGSSTPRGRWAALNPRYAERKKTAFGRKKILQLTGETKARFTRASHSEYVQEYVPSSNTRGVFRFGARSSIAAAHKAGDPLLARGQSADARRVFGGKAPRLAVRDMIAKTREQVDAIRQAFADWYINKRVPQVVRHYSRLIRTSNPRRG